MNSSLSLNVLWQKTSKPLLCVDLSSFMFKTHWTALYSHLFGLTFSWKFCFLLLRGFVPGIVLSWINQKLISLVLSSKLDPPINSQNWISCATFDAKLDHTKLDHAFISIIMVALFFDIAQCHKVIRHPGCSQDGGSLHSMGHSFEDCLTVLVYLVKICLKKVGLVTNCWTYPLWCTHNLNWSCDISDMSVKYIRRL